MANMSADLVDIDVPVTAEHIARGRRQSLCYRPTALALADVLRDTLRVEVSRRDLAFSIYPSPYAMGPIHVGRLPAPAIRLGNDFDRGLPVEPCKIAFRLPRSLLRHPETGGVFEGGPKNPQGSLDPGRE